MGLSIQDALNGHRLSDISSNSGAELELFDISVVTQGANVRSALNEIGYKYDASDLDVRLDKFSAKALNYLSELALGAAKAKVPIKGGYLRNTNLQLSTPKFTATKAGSSNSRTVFISGEHVHPTNRTYEDPKERSSVWLALALNTREWNRSRESDNSGPYASEFSTADSTGTAGWIEEAQEAFNEHGRDRLTGMF